MKRKEIAGSEELSKEEKKRLKKEKKRLEREEWEREEAEKKKKKKLGCCGILAIVALVFVVLLAGGVGAGYYFGNSYLKKNYDVSVKQILSIVDEMYDADRDDLITNAPSATDEQGFYATLNDALFLVDGTLDKESFDGIFSSVTGGEETGTLEVSGLLLSSGSATSMEELFVRANIDTSKLAAFNDGYDYAAGYDSDFIVEITDRQLMAMLRPIIEEALASREQIAENVCVEQLTLSRTADNVPAMEVIVSVKTKALVTSLLEDSGVPGIARTLIKGIMPKELFISLELTLGETTTGEIRINEMNAEQLNNAHKLISALAKKDSRTAINDFIAQSLQPTIDKIDEMLDFNGNVRQGKLKFDMFSMVAGAAFKDGDVSGKDLALLYTSVLKASTEQMLKNNEAYMFENQYRVGDAVIYSPTPVDGGTLIDYRDEFMQEFSSKYLVATEFYRDNTGKVYLPRALKGELKADGEYIQTLYMNDKNEVTTAVNTEYPTELTFTSLDFSDVAALLGLGTSDKAANLDLQSLFDAEGLTRKIGGEATADKSEWYINQTTDALKMNLSSQMLAALVDAQIGSVMGEGELTATIDLKFVDLDTFSPEQVELTDEEGNSFEPKRYQTVKRTFMTMGFTVETADLFGDVELIAGLLESKIGLVVRVELTPDLDEKYITMPEIYYADRSQARTSEMIDVLAKAGMNFLTPANIYDLIGKPVRDAIVTMNDTLGGIAFEASSMLVPDMFTLLTKQMFARDESKTYGGEVIEFEDGEIKTVLALLYDVPEVTTTDDKTYLSVNGAYDNVFVEYDDATKKHNNNTIKVDNLNAHIALSSSLPTGSALPELDPDLGRVVGYYYDGTAKKMFLAYEYSLAQYLGGDSSASGLLTVEKIYATFEIDFTEVEGVSIASQTRMTIDKMTAAQRTSLEKMLTYFDSDNENKLSDLESSVASFAVAVKVLDDAGTLDTATTIPTP